MTTRMMESRVEALEKTLATRIELLEGFECKIIPNGCGFGSQIFITRFSNGSVEETCGKGL